MWCQTLIILTLLPFNLGDGCDSLNVIVDMQDLIKTMAGLIGLGNFCSTVGLLASIIGFLLSFFDEWRSRRDNICQKLAEKWNFFDRCVNKNETNTKKDGTDTGKTTETGDTDGDRDLVVKTEQGNVENVVTPSSDNGNFDFGNGNDNNQTVQVKA